MTVTDRLREADTYDERLVRERAEDIEAAKRFWERTVGHQVDGLTGVVSGLIHDTPATGLLAPLATDLSGLTSSTTDLSGATQHDVPLLDTAGAIPTSLLHPIPLQLGFLGQPTMDGHEPHDGAFSALGVHHF